MDFIKKYKFYILFLLFVVAILIWSPIIVFGFSPGVKVWFFDVGQGDAQFLNFADGNQIIIDGGPDGSILQKLGKALPFYDRSIDLIILTHPHKDHVFGLIEVLKRYKVGKIILSKVDFESPFYREFLETAKLSNVPLEYLASGDIVRIGDFAEFDFLSPELAEGLERKNFVAENESFGAKGQNLNDSSLVAKFIFGNNSILFTGDAGINIEEMILSQDYNLKSDILKVGHHGSKYSSSEEFLKAVNPEYAVIQVGAKNKYGHPTQQTLDRLSAIGLPTQAGAKILRNDLDGDVIFESDGENLVLKTNK